MAGRRAVTTLDSSSAGLEVAVVCTGFSPSAGKNTLVSVSCLFAELRGGALCLSALSQACWGRLRGRRECVIKPDLKRRRCAGEDSILLGEEIRKKPLKLSFTFCLFYFIMFSSCIFIRNSGLGLVRICGLMLSNRTTNGSGALVYRAISCCLDTCCTGVFFKKLFKHFWK